MTFNQEAMKRTFLLFIMAALCLVSCSQRELDLDSAKEPIFITVGPPEGTRIDYTESSGAIKQSWAVNEDIPSKSDKLLIYGKNTGTPYFFTATKLLDSGKALFSGGPIDEADKLFDIIVLGQGENTSMTHLKDMINYDYSHQVQTGNANLGHLQSMVYLKDVNAYHEVEFSQEWATENGGGTFYMNPLVHFRIKIPASASSYVPKKIGLVSTASKLIPHFTGGYKVNSLWLTLDSVTPDADGVFDAYMMLPEPLGPGTYMVSLLMSNDYFYLTSNFTTTKTMSGGKVHLIQKNMSTISGWGSQAALTAHGLRTGGSFSDWNARNVLGHPLMETCTLPANPKYGDLYEVRMVGDAAWLYGYLEFKMLGYDKQLALDIVYASGTGHATLPTLGDGGDGYAAFTNENINRFFEIQDMTEPSIGKFNNWRGDNHSYGDYAAYDNKQKWYFFTGSGSLYQYTTTPAWGDGALWVAHVQAAGDYNSATSVGRLEFRMRRQTVQYGPSAQANTSFSYGFKLMNTKSGDINLYCCGLLPQGGLDASGNRVVLPMRTVTTPAYSDSAYPSAALTNESNIVTCYE